MTFGRSLSHRKINLGNGNFKTKREESGRWFNNIFLQIFTFLGLWRKMFFFQTFRDIFNTYCRGHFGIGGGCLKKNREDASKECTPQKGKSFGPNHHFQLQHVKSSGVKPLAFFFGDMKHLEDGLPVVRIGPPIYQTMEFGRLEREEPYLGSSQLANG